MRRFVARAQPSFDRVLLIESGPRKVTEEILPFLYNVKGALAVDLLTCYAGRPAEFDVDRGTLYSVNDPEVRKDRTKLIRKLCSDRYDLVALLCTGSPILAKWKWIVALRSRARLIVVNESAKYFGLDIWNLGTARLMLLKRLNPFADSSLSGFAEAGLTSFAGLLVVPFTLLYLALSTVSIHLRRSWRMRRGQHRRIGSI